MIRAVARTFNYNDARGALLSSTRLKTLRVLELLGSNRNSEPSRRHATSKAQQQAYLVNTAGISARGLAEVVARQVRARSIQVCPVQGVERLQTNIRADALGQYGESLHERTIHASESWSAESVSSEIAELSGR